MLRRDKTMKSSNVHNALSTTKIRAAKLAVLASVGLTLIKLIAGLLSGSLAVLTEALHSAVDCLAALISFFAIRVSDKPADEEHHYGHEKIEAISALITTGLLIAIAGSVLFEAGHNLLKGNVTLNPSALVFAMLGVTLAIDASRWYALHKAAKETGSQVLAADSLHFGTDFLSTLLVVISLIAAYFGYSAIDSLVAFAIALFIGISAFRLGERSINHLIDTAPKGESERLRALIKTVPRIVGIETLKLRHSGAKIIGEVVVTVSRLQPVQQMSEIKEKLDRLIAQSMPRAEITVSTLAVALDDESLVERVILIAAQKRLPIHHLFIQNIEGKTSISLDLELDGTLTIGTAHEIASDLEKAIREELGTDLEVETHIEPLENNEFMGEDACADVADEITHALEQLAARAAISLQVHDIRVRALQNYLVVHYHCYVPSTLSVQHIHDEIDKLERALKNTYPLIKRIVGHAEPDNTDAKT